MLHINGEFVFVTVASFILLFQIPPQEIMYPGRRSATALFSTSEQRDTRYILSILYYYTAGIVKYIIL